MSINKTAVGGRAFGAIPSPALVLVDIVSVQPRATRGIEAGKQSVF